tara:strand:+ start:5180 stop:6643 length:1464 start_codon:yes stop_codon:yes gene_type:complete
MGGGLMQLVAYGSQDIYLTGNPQITFFKIVYRRHTNFSIESIEQTFNQTADFGNLVSSTISRNGDLLYKMYVQVKIPSVSSNSDQQFRWLNWLGHILIDYVEIEIGGQKIDKHYGHWYHIWNELTQTAGHQSGYANLVGNVPKLVQSSSGDVPSITLYIPLQFWFCRNPGLALPLIALQYHDIKINVKFNDKSNCFWQSSTGRTPGSFVAASLYVDYIYLDTDERRKFAQVPHEYLIEQLQFTGDVAVSQTTENVKMPFNHPVKEIVWTVQKDKVINSTETADYGGFQWFNFTDQIDYTYFSGTPQDPLGGGIGTAAFNVGNFPNSLPLTGTASGNIATAGKTSNTGVNIGTLSFNDLFNDSGSRGWSADLPYFDSGENCVSEAKIQLNGHDRISTREGRYFNLVQPLQHHTNCPATGINVYSFALKPEEHQPSGTCNFSRLDIATLNLTLTADTVTGSDTAKVKVYATNYNIFRITSGMGGLAYSN